MSRIKIAPSILAADFSRLGQVVKETEEAGADYIHIDVMDGHFVPNFTIGPPVVAAIKPHTSIPLDVHLMISEPLRLISEFAAAGADIITVHAEAVQDLKSAIKEIKGNGVRSGVALHPETPVTVLEGTMEELDLALCMTVNPGYGGQTFIPSSMDKVRELRELINRSGFNVELEVDGGINDSNVSELLLNGADVIVAGSAVYGAKKSLSECIERLRNPE